MACPICPPFNHKIVEANDGYDTVTKKTNYHVQSRTRKFLVKVGADNDEFYVDLRLLQRLTDEFKEDTNLSDVTCEEFHAFIEALCPTVHGLRPTKITEENIVPVLKLAARFGCESLMTACERALIIGSIDYTRPDVLLRLIDVGMSAYLDNQILCRLLRLCLTSTGLLEEATEYVKGNMGTLLAHAFIDNAAGNFRHQSSLEEDGATAKFKCTRCFRMVKMSANVDSTFCYQALADFVGGMRESMWPAGYRTSCDREQAREAAVDRYIAAMQTVKSFEDIWCVFGYVNE